jgi:histone H3/H4
VRGDNMSADSIVIRSKLRDVVKGLNISGDFPTALDEEVKLIISRAVERAKANNRKTLMGKDI